jgi:hypothetical protein
MSTDGAGTRCAGSFSEVTPRRVDCERGSMECWVCRLDVPVEQYEHPRYGQSWMVSDHPSAEPTT